MTLSTPSSGHDPALPAEKPKPRLQDIHGEALKLAGLLHILDHDDPYNDSKGQGWLLSLTSVVAELAWKITDNLEQVM